MTTPIPGLKPFDVTGQQECSLQRFQWVLPGTLARSSQPGYRRHDEPHTIRPYEATLLRMKKIVRVISANHFSLDQAGAQLLTMARIDFIHEPVQDFTAPTTAQLRRVADTIEDRRTRQQNPGATLVYCGFGRGRTGTYVAGWAMLKYMVRSRVKDMFTFTSLAKQFGVERPEQAQAICAAAGQPYVAVAGAGNGNAPSFPSFVGLQGSGSGSFAPHFPDHPGFAMFNSGQSEFRLPGSGPSKFYKGKF